MKDPYPSTAASMGTYNIMIFDLTWSFILSLRCSDDIIHIKSRRVVRKFAGIHTSEEQWQNKAMILIKPVFHSHFEWLPRPGCFR